MYLLFFSVFLYPRNKIQLTYTNVWVTLTMSDKLQFIWNIFTETNKGYFVNNAFISGIWHFNCICHDFYIKIFELITCNLPHVHSLHYSFYFLTFFKCRANAFKCVHLSRPLCNVDSLYIFYIFLMKVPKLWQIRH